jgi:hypothetical protein
MSYDDDYYQDPATNYENEFVVFNPKESYVDNDSDYSSVSTNRKKQRKYRDEIKKIDKGYHKLKRFNNSTIVDVEVYSTNSNSGTMIRDAITGARNKDFRVGTKFEHLFFKVALSTGELGTNCDILFFDSPEQFERHFKNSVVVKQTIKEKWTNKCVEIRTLIK